MIAAVILAATLVAQAGAPQAAPRDNDTRPTTGTGSISGVVVTDGDQPRPVRRAIVSLTGDGLRPNRGAITDDDGRFAIGNLPAGRFTLTVTRGAFITSVYGAKRPGRQGTPIAVRDGEKVTNITVTIWRGAAISGVVRDDAGALARNVPVRAISAHAASTTGIFTLSNNGVTTNDTGEYRIFGLEPGSYVVVAKPVGTGEPMTAMSEADVDAALEAVRTKSTAPPARAVGTGGASAMPFAPFDYAPVFFPGALNITQATPVTLGPGQEMANVDFTLQRVPTLVVDGVVTKPDGQPAAGATVQIMAATPPGPYAIDAPFLASATADPEGRFRFAQMTQGDYQILVRAPVQPPTPPPANGGFVSFSPNGQGPQLWGEQNVTVGGADVHSLGIRVEPGVTVSGRIEVSSDSAAKPNLVQVRVLLLLPAIANGASGAATRTIQLGPGGTTKADGTFEVANQPPGSFLFIVGGLPKGWTALSAMAGGRDLLDGAVTYPLGTVLTDVVVTITDRHSEISGTLQQASGQPASDVFVIAYSADRRTWGPNSRRVKAVRPSVDGHYAIADLPPGDYLVAAVADVDPGEWEDPAFLAQLVPASLKLTVADGEKKVQNLRLGGS
jgi:hypothetical protein